MNGFFGRVEKRSADAVVLAMVKSTLDARTQEAEKYIYIDETDKKTEKAVFCWLSVSADTDELAIIAEKAGMQDTAKRLCNWRVEHNTEFAYTSEKVGVWLPKKLVFVACAMGCNAKTYKNVYLSKLEEILTKKEYFVLAG